jgi:hypothetical protein
MWKLDHANIHKLQSNNKTQQIGAQKWINQTIAISISLLNSSSPARNCDFFPTAYEQWLLKP